MNNAIPIRTVTVELLRSGPSHNQLLSPLTNYLGICGDSVAGIVNLPYEHATFLRRMKAMRYDGGGEDQERLAVLRDIGVDMARILSAIPSLPGALNDGDHNALVHLRLTLSASELALLPFELAKMPVGPNGEEESWLALQTRTPVCITRRHRNAASRYNPWPTRPRILFIAAHPATVPFAEHRAELLEAVKPYLYPGQELSTASPDGRREQFGDWLTILQDACFEEVVAECASNQYTHIHLLAHGDGDPSKGDTAYGLVLRTAAGNPEVVSGERFASAFARITGGRIHRPTVVTLATCDSGNVGSVIIPGASLAHALHLAGIPLVVASQFPLSKDGSVAVVRTLYQGLLAGGSPWILLHRIRSDLHGRFAANTHDWASLVVYEALPGNLDSQLEALCYHQAKRAISAALERVDRAIGQTAPGSGGDHSQLDEAVRRACDMLPLGGEFNVECLALRASSRKRLAEAEYGRAMARGAGSPDYHSCLRESCDYLEQARLDYLQAATCLLVNDGTRLQRLASLHWVMVQMLSLAAVLGRPLSIGAWETAKYSAESYLDHPATEERAWAHGSLAELWLLRLAEGGASDAAQQAKEQAAELVKLFPAGDAFPVDSTRKQFERYAHWWGDPGFAQWLAEWGGEPRPSSWRAEGGIVETANALAAILARRKPGGRATPDAPARAETAVEPEAKPTQPMASPTAAPAFLGKPEASHGEPWLSIEMLPAGHGDSLWLEYGEGQSAFRILVDCGTDSTYPHLQQRVARLPEKKRDIELFILSHIDADHIGGAIPFFKDQTLGVRFADVWFNGWKHLPSDKLGAKQGEIFSALIQQYRLPWNQWRDGGPVMLEGDELPACTLPGGMRLTLLSPTADKLATLAKKWKKEIQDLGLHTGTAADFTQFLRGTPSTSTNVDTLAAAPFKPDAAAPNGSSIAVLAEYQGKSILLGADAHAPLLVASIQKLLKQRGAERLKIDAFKVSHHASQNNLNIELMQLLDCRHYLVSTNGDHFSHPDREAVARIIKHGGDKPSLHFNFRTALNDVWEQPDLQEQYGYQAVYPEAGQAGLLVRL